tara:strand:+ start:1834 stop:2076 length:243 start_codon:yes stop_codon:yes gene_type:complete
MDKFLEAMKESGIIQQLRGSLTEEEKLQFDKIVEATMKEYGGMWAEVEPLINNYNSKVKEYAAESKTEQRQDIQSDDEQS